MLRIAFSLLLFTFSLSLSAQQDKDIKAVKLAMDAQQQAWNQGDLNTFMRYYWNSADVQFINSSGVTKGWNATMERYEKTYPTKEDMGNLVFEIIQTDKREKKVITVSGKYVLSRENRNLVGYFLLVWQKMDGNWVIVADSTN